MLVPSAVWSRVLRLSALLLVLAGVLSGASNIFPQDSDPTELLHDVRYEQVSSVHVIYLSPFEVQVRWTDGYLGEKAYIHRFSSLPEARSSSDAYVDILRQRLGTHAGAVDFDMRDPLARLGGLSLVMPVLYWRFIAVAWLKWATLAVLAACVIDMVRRTSIRAPNPGYWLSASFLLGSGFLAYLWSEPFSLRRAPAEDGGRSVRMAGWGVALRSLAWLVAVPLVAAAVLTLR
ncbi:MULTISPECIES: hypothetical protein [Streptomyces]|uniref:hypothetical protein n=1 Tax=Streptomyces TaxID=1883 RepID=UPI0010BDEDC7|nr:hypothetical protein [Streptomyces californicus]NEA09843.1 hypothetical protein [Streptomyces sp. SID10692]